MEKCNTFLLKSIIVLSVINYTPIRSSLLSLFLYITFLLLIVCNNKIIFNKIFFFKNIIIITWIIIIYFLLLLFYSYNTNIGDLYSLVSTCLIFLVLVNLNISQESGKNILTFFSYIIIFATLLAAIYYTRTVVNTSDYVDGQYFFIGKNGLGPMLAMGSFYLFYDYFVYKNQSIHKVILSFIGLFLLSYIKARTAFFSLLITLGIFIIKHGKLNYKKLFILYSLLMMSLLFLPYIINKLLESLNVMHIINNMHSTSTFDFYNNLTSYRLNHYIYAINLFFKNPLFGSMFDEILIQGSLESASGIHSTVFRALAYGGLFYFILFSALCFAYFKYISRAIKNNKVIIYIIVIPIIAMFFEPSAPFGPGTAYLMFWMLVAFNQEKKKGE